MLERNGAINDNEINKSSKPLCDVNKNLQDCSSEQHCLNLDFQGSLEDEEFLREVEKVESKVPTFGMDGLDSPTHCPTFVDMPTTSSAICVTPKKGETTDIQTTNETTPVKNTLPVMSELKFTPVTQLARCTAKVKLNTPKSSKINEQLKLLSAPTSKSDGYHGNHLSSFSAFVSASYINTNKFSYSLFNNQNKVSYSLVNIYKRTFGCEPTISHTAEDDCKTLLQCVKRKSPDFIRWVDRNAVLLSNIEALS